ncbi:hypothetical protein [Streptomyces sp. NPDC048191]|uniref:hypothetical protein n=1 Tax=Streptomyces sp. NPDC048191 TaxID=3155484 RepID=UPI0033E4CF6A
MNRNAVRISMVGLAAAALVGATSVSNAYAATGVSGCSTTGSSGGATFTNWTSKHVDIQDMNVYDTASDGYSVAIRLISYNGSTSHYWPWHHNYKGAGTSIHLDTTASDAYGPLKKLTVEVGTFKGSEEWFGCTDSCPSPSVPADGPAAAGTPARGPGSGRGGRLGAVTGTAKDRCQPRSSAGGVRSLSTFSTRTSSPHTTYRYSEV